MNRKDYPMATGVLDYFPDALREVANVSRVGNEQHNPGTPLHWDKSKSTDEADALLRHLAQRGALDDDGIRHTAKVAWRALALLQRELDAVTVRRPLPPLTKRPIGGHDEGYYLGDVNETFLHKEKDGWIIDSFHSVKGKPNYWTMTDGECFETAQLAWDRLMDLVEEQKRAK